jgi:RNA polymerase sigma factor (sigma-70 family)
VLGFDADSLDFVTSTRSLTWHQEDDRFVRANANEVGYRLKIATGSEEPRVDDHPALLAERDHERAEVREALGRLPEAQREAIVLAYWGGLTADQIARRSHVPLGTAKSRIRLGLARLREEFPVAA